MKTRILLVGSVLLLFISACGQSNTPSGGLADPTQTAAPTGSPSATPDPVRQAQQAALLYSQDFEQGNTDGLYDGNQGVWSIAADQSGNHMYCNDKSDQLDNKNEQSYQFYGLNFGAYEWSNYAVELRVKALKWQNSATLTPFVSVFTRFDVYQYLQYYASLNFGAGEVQLGYYSPQRLLGQKEYQPHPQSDKWYTLRVEAAGDTLSYYVNNRLVAQGTDNQRSSGKAGFSVSPNISVCLDDIRVWALAPDGQIAQPLPAKPAPRTLAERLAAHKFPRLLFTDLDSDPTSDALDESIYNDILVVDPTVSKTEWAYFGPTGIIRTRNPNAVILATYSVQEFFPWDNSTYGKGFVAGLKPEWILRDIHGNPTPSFCCYDGKWSYMMNLSTDVSTYIPDYLNEKVLKTGFFDGIFYDGTNQVWWQTHRSDGAPGGPVDINGDGKPDTAAEFSSAMDAGMQKLLLETRRVLPAGLLIGGNAGDGSLFDKQAKTDTTYPGLLNGRGIESFLAQNNINSNDWFTVMRNYALMEAASTEPKIPMISALCNGSDAAFLRYVISSTLLFDGYLACANYDLANPQYSVNETWWYDEYSVDLASGKAVKSLAAKGYLGLPTGEAYNADDPTQLLSTLLMNSDLHAKSLVWRRDFQNGIVLVNPTGSAKTVELGGTYRKILGIYDPGFNDGAVVTEISLSPKSGIVLLKLP